jgi:hypothetical protein
MKASFIDYVLGATVAVYYSCERFFNRGTRCPSSGDGIHLWVVRGGDYKCRYCGIQQPRVGVGADGRDR